MPSILAKFKRELCIIMGLFFIPTSSQAKDVFDLLGYGVDYKNSAGAGIVNAKGSPANYYNPANLINSTHGDVEYEIDLIDISYKYTYPTYQPVALKKTTPLVFLGWSSRVNRKFAYGLSFLPILSKANSLSIESLPTRVLSSSPDAKSKPILVDVEQTGKNDLDYKASIGFAYQVVTGWTLGVSLLADKQSESTTIRDTLSHEIAAKTSTSSHSKQVVLGSKYVLFAGDLTISGHYKLPESTVSEGQTTFPVFNNTSLDTGQNNRGPAAVGFGIQMKVDDFIPFIEIKKELWSQISDKSGFIGTSKADYEYFDASSIVLGSDYRYDIYIFNVGYGKFESPLGDGVMKKESAHETELIGMQFQDLHFMQHKRASMGVLAKTSLGDYQTGVSVIDGERSVWDKGRGYGTYELQIIQCNFSGTYRF